MGSKYPTIEQGGRGYMSTHIIYLNYIKTSHEKETIYPIFIKKLDSKIALIGSVIAALLSVTSIIFLFCIVSSFTSVNDVSAKGFSLATTPIIAIISSFIVLGLIVTTVYLEHFKKGQ